MKRRRSFFIICPVMLICDLPLFPFLWLGIFYLFAIQFFLVWCILSISSTFMRALLCAIGVCVAITLWEVYKGADLNNFVSYYIIITYCLPIITGVLVGYNTDAKNNNKDVIM